MSQDVSASAGWDVAGESNWPRSLPAALRAFLRRALPILSADPRLVGVAAAGSFAEDALDEFSDLDLVIAVEPGAFDAVQAERRRLATSLGGLLAAFTGEHVGEPRLLICLYRMPSAADPVPGRSNVPPASSSAALIHVDLKFVALPDAARRVDEPVVLWERDGRLSAVLRSAVGRYPPLDEQWIEDRFWTWVHYAAARIGRGELFESIEFLSFLRVSVLGPLGLVRAGLPPRGVRRIESLAPGLAADLQRTVATHDRSACVTALRACVDVYRKLRDSAAHGVCPQVEAEAAAIEYLAAIGKR